MNNSSMAVALGLHSFYSLRCAVLGPAQLLKAAAEKGFSAVGLADCNNLYGLINFLEAACSLNLKPLIGARVYLEGHELFQLYVKNIIGFKRLNWLLSKVLLAQTGQNFRRFSKDTERGFELKEQVLQDLLQNGWEGLSLISAEESILRRLAAVSKNDLYVKLIYGKPFSFELALARSLDLKPLAMLEILATKDEDALFYRFIRAIALNCNVSNLAKADQLKPYQFLPSSEKWQNYFASVPEAIRNTCLLAAESSFDFVIQSRPVFPAYKGMNSAEAFFYLKKLCQNGISLRYGKENQKIKIRLDYELAIIKAKGFANYFLVVYDIVKNFSRTCGRGSAAASLVSYLLGLTQVDPLRYNLFFERFLNPERNDPPDIDLDFPWDEREAVLNYVFKNYPQQAALVADHVSFGPRSCLREIAKAWGLPEGEIKTLQKFYLWKEYSRIPSLLLKMAERLKGQPNYIGTHPGGLVITPKKLWNYSHFQYSAQGYPVLAWEKEGVETAGLVKIDILGNRSLSVLRDCLKLVNKRHNLKLEWSSFNPVSDSATQRLMAKGDTVGIFYIESQATRQLLPQMGKIDYKKLIIATSLIRPAANRYQNEYVRRLKQQSYQRLHPILDKLLEETLGIMVYQEDVLRVVMELAGFSVAEADGLRKILAKSASCEMLAKFYDCFLTGALKQGVNLSLIQTVW